MRKNAITSGSIILAVLLLFSGCQKQINEPSSPAETDLQTEESQSRNGHDDHGSECRLTSLVSSAAEYTYHYNRNGLANEWNISDYGLFKQEYNSTGRLIKSRLYVSGELVYTIRFIYKNNKVSKEIWYEGNTQIVYDEVFYTYNRQGQMIRQESFIGDYYTTSTFNAQGNVSAWDFYYAGSPFYSARYKFIEHYKNPYLAVPGIEYGFPFINACTSLNKWWPTSEKIILYDEEGNPYVSYDYDPKKTIWVAAQQNYPASANYFDRISENWFLYSFDYENCGRRHGYDNNKSLKQTPPASRSVNKNNSRPPMFLIHVPSKSIKQQVEELRSQFRK